MSVLVADVSVDHHAPRPTTHRRGQSKPALGSAEKPNSEKQKEKCKHDYTVDHVKGNSWILAREDASDHFLYCLYLWHRTGD